MGKSVPLRGGRQAPYIPPKTEREFISSALGSIGK